MVFYDEEKEILKIGLEPVRIRVVSEPYVTYSPFGYAPVIDVWLVKKKREYRLYISAASLSSNLEKIRENTEFGKFTGLEFWIRKESSDRKSAYILEEA
ncbi:MAG: hypothetical protein ACR2P9_05430 [Gammaproteobacteria bacterium]